MQCATLTIGVIEGAVPVTGDLPGPEILHLFFSNYAKVLIEKKPLGIYWALGRREIVWEA